MTQKGSLVSPERLRFDFSHNKPIEKEEMTKINNIVNEIVEGSSDVQTRIMTPKEAVGMGALALFGEKYGCLLYTSPSPRDKTVSRMPSSA